MEKLNLPVLKGKMPQGRRLSMNDYLKFVNLHLKYTFNRKAARRWKKMSAVNVAFSL